MLKTKPIRKAGARNKPGTVECPTKREFADLVVALSDEANDLPISAYAEVAADLGLPLWAMVIPGTTRDMFEDISKVHRLVQLMQDYLDASDSQRGNVEAMAAGLAEINRNRVAEVVA